MFFAAVLLAVLGADPSCSSGIASGTTCCYASCGACGDEGCSDLPGGPSMCCKGTIAAGGYTCDQFNPPCRLVPPSPPAPYPQTATIDLDANTPVAEVPTTYLSFTIDSAYWRSSWFDLGGKDDSVTGKYGATLDVLIAALRPSILRVGGTQGDYDVYVNFSAATAGIDCDHLPKPMTDFRCKSITPDQWKALLGFAARNDLSLVFGLNGMFGRPPKTKPETPQCNATAPAGDAACPARDTVDYEALISWTVTNRPPGWDHLIGFELGNELNEALNGLAGARTQAEDLLQLKAYLDRTWPVRDTHGDTRRDARPGALRSDGVPVTAGPDTHSNAEWSAEMRAWFGQFANTTHGRIGALTFHEYSMGNGPDLDPQKLRASFLDPAMLDRSGNGARALLAMLPPSAPGQSPPIWAGETAAATNGGQTGITDTFVDGFWYLDQLGQHALVGVQTLFRQTLLYVGGSYPLIELTALDASTARGRAAPPAHDGARPAGETPTESAHDDARIAGETPTEYTVNPLPDYWLAVLHKRLMGQIVLNTTSSSRGLRVYAHCAVGRGVGLSFLNLDETRAINLTLPDTLAQLPSRLEYILTAGVPIEGAAHPLQSRGVRLNGGDELSLQPSSGGTPSLPKLHGLSVAQSGASGARVPAGSLGFLVWPDAQLPACAKQRELE